MESSLGPRSRRRVPARSYVVPPEDPFEWEESEDAQIDSVHSEVGEDLEIDSVHSEVDEDLEIDSVHSEADEVFSTDLEASTSASDGEDDGEDAGIDSVHFVARVKEKLTRWGAFEKDWTAITDLETYLRTQPGKGIPHLKRMIEDLRNNRMSIEQFELQIASADQTNYYWSIKSELQRLAGKKVVLLMGFCPQYNITLENNSAEIAPEDSECLTSLVVSWLARQSDGNLLCWDFRHDCKKVSAPAKSHTGYAKCAPIDMLKTESEQLNYLSYILLLVAQSLYSIEIQGTISFSVCTNQFVRVLDNVPRITLDEHISRIGRKPILAVDLVSKMAESKLYGDQRWQDLYNNLAAFLVKGRGRESGRALVKLPPLMEQSTEPITFEELISLTTKTRKDYGRNASTIGRQRTKAREAADPEYAKQRKDTVRAYKAKDYEKIKKMRGEDPEAYRKWRNIKNEKQRKLRAKQPGYAKAYNDKVKQKRLDDPEFNEMYKERKKGIDKKCKDKKRGKL